LSLHPCYNAHNAQRNARHYSTLQLVRGLLLRAPQMHTWLELGQQRQQVLPHTYGVIIHVAHQQVSLRAAATYVF
jgi:hypothetical protein